MKQHTWRGFLRADGQAGTRNLTLVISLSDLTNDVTARSALDDPTAVAMLSATGGLSHGAELALSQSLRVRLASNPNVGAVVLIGPAQEELQRLASQLQNLGKPIEIISAFDHSDSNSAVEHTMHRLGILRQHLANERRHETGLGSLHIGLRSSSTTMASGLVVHTAIGHVVDWLGSVGASVVFTEIADLAGVADRVRAKIDDPQLQQAIGRELLAAQTILHDLGSRAPDPTPTNAKGGLDTIAKKGATALRRLGTAKIVSLLEFGAAPTSPGLHMMKGPGSAFVSLLGLAAAGCNLLTYTVGAASMAAKLPIVPTILLGPSTLTGDSDLDVRLSDKNATDEIVDRITASASGDLTKSEMTGIRLISLPNSLSAI